MGRLPVRNIRESLKIYKKISLPFQKHQLLDRPFSKLTVERQIYQ
jgi:hypothetical protein